MITMRHLAATMACLLFLPAAAQAQLRELMDLYTHLHTHPELSLSLILLSEPTRPY